MPPSVQLKIPALLTRLGPWMLYPAYILLVLLFDIVFELNWEGNDDVINALLYKGGIIDFPLFPDLRPLYGHGPMGFVLAWLYQLAPSVSWYGWYGILLLAGCLWLQFYCLLAVTGRRYWYLALLIPLFLFPSYGLYTSFTRISITLSFSAICYIVSLRPLAPALLKSAAPAFLALVLAAWARPDGALLGALLAAPAWLVFWKNRGIAPKAALVALCIAGGCTWYWSYSYTSPLGKELTELNRERAGIADFKTYTDTLPLSPRNTVIFSALGLWMVFDPCTITAGNIDQMLAAKKTAKSRQTASPLQHISQCIRASVSANVLTRFRYIAILLIPILAIAAGWQRDSLRPLILFACWTAMLFLLGGALEYSLKFPARLAEPIVITAIFSAFLLLSLQKNPPLLQLLPYAGIISAAILLGGLGWQLRRLHQPAYNNTAIAQACAATQALQQQHLLLSDVSPLCPDGASIWHDSRLQNSHQAPAIQPLIHLLGWNNLTDTYVETMRQQQQCGSTGPAAYYRSLFSTPGTRYISWGLLPIPFLSRYFKEIHGIELTFTPLQTQPVPGYLTYTISVAR